MSFGEYLKTKRMAQDESLRGFCLKHNLDPGNISKLERGVMAPPKDLTKIAESLGFKDGDKNWIELYELADKTRAAEHFKNVNENVAEKLPQFFRTIDNQNLTEDKLQKIIDFLSKE